MLCNLQLELGLLIDLSIGVGVDGIVVVRTVVPLGQEGASFFIERDDVHVSLSPANDPSLTLIMPLEGLNLFIVTSRGSEVIIREDFEHHGPLLGEVVEVARDLGVLHQKP
ncbi:hypothetical protein BHE74_00036056 [Ensete ventricosum]|nr:hypothetical protein BHE74_00036056 [Ensete ventricosum]RZS00188.1 hypothetical protein BHM03_00029850 [Ensete ventricosum]